MGLVNKVVRSENLMSEAESLAATLADWPFPGLCLDKKRIQPVADDFRQVLEMEANLQAIAF